MLSSVCFFFQLWGLYPQFTSSLGLSSLYSFFSSYPSLPLRLPLSNDCEIASLPLCFFCDRAVWLRLESLVNLPSFVFQVKLFFSFMEIWKIALQFLQIVCTFLFSNSHYNFFSSLCLVLYWSLGHQI